jgi:hypothetical protein
MRRGAGAAAATAVALLLSAGCTGGQEGSAAEEQAPARNPIVVQQQHRDASETVQRSIKSISPAIPIYADAQFRDDLTRRDVVMARSQYGPDAEVYTLATNDSYPQVYHYYTTYLAQFRAFTPQTPYPPEQQNWRSLEVQLNQAMQDPFIPGDTLAATGKQVLLQIAETEAEPKTVIRYVITPAPVATASAAPPNTPAAPQ